MSDDANDKPLRDNVRLLGDLLGETLREQESVALFELVEQVRRMSKEARASSERSFDELSALLANVSLDDTFTVARAFAHFLNLANVAEQQHRTRRRRDYERNDASPQPGSPAATIALLRAQRLSADAIYDTVLRTRIELVLTAHPTEVVRRTLLHKYDRISRALDRLDRSDLTKTEEAEVHEQLRREIAAAWGTSEARVERPSPLDEVRGGLYVFEQSVWNALPRFMRELDRVITAECGRALPLDTTPVTFGSWIGGDRDGNPNVTAAVTEEACLLSRWVAADLFERELSLLRDELSLNECSEELRTIVGDAHEPYRALLKPLHEKLRATRLAIEQRVGPGNTTKHDTIVESQSDILEPLLLCHRSLNECGDRLVADGRLLDAIRRAYTFGATLVRLDIREDARKHTELLDAITTSLELGVYGSWSEKEKLTFLERELESRRPLIPEALELSESARGTLETFRLIARTNRESLGAYVITMASTASDVLAVHLLQKAVGVSAPLRVVPLFETIKDLRGAAEVLRRLFENKTYRHLIEDKQEVMIGYSDSSKEAGRLAAGWELYTAQRDVVSLCRDAKVELTLFHGRGGSVGRGGGPTFLAIASQPPGSVDGRLRVTVQGEMIQANFGLPEIALRTLEVYISALLQTTLAQAQPPKPEWEEAMRELAERSRAAYREIVYETPAFLDYFRAVTPEVELGSINIGSRPSRRQSGTKSGVESLRAIPWQFAWTQNRLLLPSWLGVAEALRSTIEDGKLELLRDMAQQWDFFQSLLDLMEMVLAKAEPDITLQYERALVPSELHDLGADLRRRLSDTVELVLTISEHEQLLENNRPLRRSIGVRNPYVDPINLVQVEVLKRYRANPSDGLWRALVVTVNGIAAGMRNTG